MQLTELRGYAARMGWPAPIEYVEKASGKAGAKRPVQSRLLAAARLREIDVVLVWKMDRFGRSLSDLATNIRTLDECGVRFMIPGQGIDTANNSPMGKLMVGLFGLFAEFERELIAERTVAGSKEYARMYEAGGIGDAPGQKQSRSKRNLPPGRPKRIFRRDEAAKLRKLGWSWRAMARHLNVSASTLRGALGG